MNIERDARVLASDGEFGRVQHVIVDPDTREVTHLVVSGANSRDGEWMIPMAEVASVEGNRVRLVRDRATITAAYPFDRGAYQAVDDDRAREESTRDAVRGGAPLLDATGNAVQVGTVSEAVGVTSQAAPVARAEMTETTETVGMTETTETVGMTETRTARDERDITTSVAERDLRGAEPFRLQLREERLAVQREAVQAGVVRISRRVTERVETVEVPLREETLIVEKVSGSGRVILDGRELGDGETIEIELRRERATVQKEVYVAEDITIRKDAHVYTDRLEGVVRREQLVVEDPNALVAGGRRTEGGASLTGRDMGGSAAPRMDDRDVSGATGDIVAGDEGMPLSRETVSGSTAIIGERSSEYAFGALDTAGGKDELVGLPLVTTDGSALGTVGEVRGDLIRVSAPMAADYWIQRSAIASMAPGGDLMLRVDKDGLDSVKVTAPREG